MYICEVCPICYIFKKKWSLTTVDKCSMTINNRENRFNIRKKGTKNASDLLLALGLKRELVILEVVLHTHACESSAVQTAVAVLATCRFWCFDGYEL